MKNKINTIQIYGERCSGTNYLENLIKRNLKDIEIKWDHGWKHFFHKAGVEQADNCLFIVLYRNPFDWLRSFYLNPWHTAQDFRDISFSEFIRKEWVCIWDKHLKSQNDPLFGKEMMIERDPETNQRFKNVIQLRAAKIRNWESLKNKTSHHFYMRYEELKSNPELFINEISARFNIKKKFFFKNITGYKNQKKWLKALLRRHQYKAKEYDPIIQDDLQFITDELDIELEKSIGYDISELIKLLNYNNVAK